MLGAQVLEIPSDAQDGVNLDRLEEALRTYAPCAFYLMSGVANPSEVSTSRDACARIADLARTHNCFVIEDTTSLDLLYEKKMKGSVKEFDANGRVLVCASVSKSVAAGLRVGWIAAGDLADSIRELHYCTSLNTDNVSQYVAWSFMKSGRLARHIAAAAVIHRQTVVHIVGRLRGRLGDRIELLMPAGGFCVWLRAAGYDLAGHAAALAAENGVSVAPGSIFTASGKYGDCMRIGWGGRWSDKVGQSLDIVAEAIDATIGTRRLLGHPKT